jgi:hypothetical protein
MRWPKKELLVPSLVATFNMLVVVNIFATWIFVQFVHYHSQNTPLSPNDYLFELATKEDMEKLSDSSVGAITLSDGRYFVKAPGWHELNMPQYYAPSVDGRWYVLVMTKGTAHFTRRWIENILFVLMAALPALVLSIWNLRRIGRLAQPSVLPEGAGDQRGKS